MNYQVSRYKVNRQTASIMSLVPKLALMLCLFLQSNLLLQNDVELGVKCVKQSCISIFLIYFIHDGGVKATSDSK